MPARPDARWDLVALGEVMLRLDPGEDRIHTTRTFRAWEGGGEYNVARGLARTFGRTTTVVTALADNPIGRLIEDLIRQGGVDRSHLRWEPYDGIGRAVRNGLNFTERGFGVRAAVGCSDRANSAASQLRAGEIDWEAIFGVEGARWLHTGGIFAALSESTPGVVSEAVDAARRSGAIVSFDLNYRDSLWRGRGGRAAAQAVLATIVETVDVLIGNEEDFGAALGLDAAGVDDAFDRLDPAAYRALLEATAARFPNLRAIAVTLRVARTASRNDWGALLWDDGRVHAARNRQDLEILDRIGGGDSFASGLIHGYLAGLDPSVAVEYGAAHGALAMTTPGDTSTATLAEVEAVISGGGARVRR
ncbi:MAG TPA: sugar kinase [Candidatus Limnocylindrales bacterium]